MANRTLFQEVLVEETRKREGPFLIRPLLYLKSLPQIFRLSLQPSPSSCHIPFLSVLLISLPPLTFPRHPLPTCFSLKCSFGFGPMDASSPSSPVLNVSESCSSGAFQVTLSLQTNQPSGFPLFFLFPAYL